MCSQHLPEQLERYMVHFTVEQMRFHSLIEFDKGKRSCRKCLDGHNRRRRKPQSDSSSRNTGRFLSNQQGVLDSYFGYL
ncbi:Squamosa promoter-binding-like protein 18 [Sarracenia purpurea var. burkii]